MNICLNTQVIEKAGLSVQEVLYLLMTDFKVNEQEVIKSLTEKGFISVQYSNLFQPEGYFLPNAAKELLSNIIIDSDPKQEPEERLIKLATALKEIFPKGKKDGTNFYWSDGVALIVRRLKLFFKKYGEYSDEQILSAAKRYVNGFNGQYRYMQLLKYFIFKDKVGASHEVEVESQLVSHIENSGEENELKDDWTSQLK